MPVHDDELTIGQERVLELISLSWLVNLVDHPDDVTVDIVRRDDRDVYQVHGPRRGPGQGHRQGRPDRAGPAGPADGRQRAHGPAHRAGDRRVSGMDCVRAHRRGRQGRRAAGARSSSTRCWISTSRCWTAASWSGRTATPARCSGTGRAGGCVAVWPEGSDRPRRGRSSWWAGSWASCAPATWTPDFPRPAGGLPFRYLGRQVVTAAGEAIGTVDEVRLAGGQLLLVRAGRAGRDPDPGGRADPAAGRRPRGRPGDRPPEGLLDVHRD